MIIIIIKRITTFFITSNFNLFNKNLLNIYWFSSIILDAKSKQDRSIPFLYILERYAFGKEIAI